MDKWDLRFLRLAKEVSTWSRDPSTKCGAIIVSPDRHILATGYNGLPRWMEDKEEWYNNREEKYKRIIHCEMNAIMQAKYTDGCSLYTWPDMSCARCCVHMIQAGISNCFSPLIKGEHPMQERWGADFTFAKEAFRAAGVHWEGIEWPEVSI